LFFEGDPNLRHASGIGGIYLLPTIILLAGGILGFKAKQKWVIAWLGLWWLAAIIPASIPKEVPHALRSLNSLPPVVLLMGVGGDKLLTQLFQKSKRLAWIVLIGWIGATGWCFFNYWHDYWHHYPLRSAESWQWGYKQAALAAGEAGTNYKVIKFEPIDRINHYVWFFNRIEPQAVINKETPFIFDVAGDKLKPNCGEVSLVRASTADSFEMKPYLLTLATINDYANQPLYQLITLRCPEEMAKNGH